MDRSTIFHLSQMYLREIMLQVTSQIFTVSKAGLLVILFVTVSRFQFLAESGMCRIGEQSRSFLSFIGESAESWLFLPAEEDVDH